MLKLHVYLYINQNHSLIEKLFVVTYFRQLEVSYATKKSCIHHLLVAYDIFSWIGQVAKKKKFSSDLSNFQNIMNYY